MKLITLRVTKESAAFVTRVSAERSTTESAIWRELIDLGLQRSDEVLSVLDRISKLSVQTLCMSQRVASHVNDDLVDKARDDARVLIARLDESKKLGTGR